MTTINLTMINGGHNLNVVPTELSVTFDIRLAIDVDIKKNERNYRRMVS